MSLDLTAGTPRRSLANGGVSGWQYGSDANLRVRFYRSPIDDKDHIEIIVPGDKNFAPDFIVSEQHKQRFAEQWERYQNGAAEFEGQTLLNAVAWIDPGTADILRANHVHTVDQLAGVHDGNLRNIGAGARALREKARAHVDQQQKMLQAKETRDELDALRLDYAALQTRLDAIETAGDPQTSQEALEELGLKKGNRGWYVLSDGRKVKGMVHAMEEQKRLNVQAEIDASRHTADDQLAATDHGAD